MIWTVRLYPAVCGACNVEIPAMDPIALVSPAKLVRCSVCVEPVDWGEVENERWRLREEQRRLAAWRAAHAHTFAGAPVRYRIPRRVLAADAVMGLAFDAKLAALGEDQEGNGSGSLARRGLAPDTSGSTKHGRRHAAVGRKVKNTVAGPRGATQEAE